MIVDECCIPVILGSYGAPRRSCGLWRARSGCREITVVVSLVVSQIWLDGHGLWTRRFAT